MLLSHGSFYVSVYFTKCGLPSCCTLLLLKKNFCNNLSIISMIINSCIALNRAIILNNDHAVWKLPCKITGNK